jgi:HTH-type transcriptional regulator/antitoxin HigA
LELLIENYEEAHYSIEDPDPINAIRYVMGEEGMNQNDLGGLLGGKSRASLILDRKRKLSLQMIRNLHKKLKIPLEVLIKEYPLVH